MEKQVLPRGGDLSAPEVLDGIVRIQFADQVVSELAREIVLHKRRPRTAYYIPMEDMREEYSEPSEQTSICPFKGNAKYQTQKIGHLTETCIAWSYEVADANMADNEAASVKDLTNTPNRPETMSNKLRKCFANQPVSLDLIDFAKSLKKLCYSPCRTKPSKLQNEKDAGARP